MLCGGIQTTGEITEFATAFVEANPALVNAALSVNATRFVILKEAVQVVNGVNHFLHINDNDGNEYTITVLEQAHPNHGGLVTKAQAGHQVFSNQ
jgi:hypothetical protein